MINPTFSQRNLNTFIPKLEELSRTLTDRMSYQVGGEEFEVIDYVALCSFEIICGIIDFFLQTSPRIRQIT